MNADERDWGIAGGGLWTILRVRAFAALSELGVRPNEFKVLVGLLAIRAVKQSNMVTASQRWLAKELGMRKHEVKVALDHLVERSLLELVKKGSSLGVGRGGHAAIYDLRPFLVKIEYELVKNSEKSEELP